MANESAQFDYNELDPSQFQQRSFDIALLSGLIPTVSSVPTHTPRKFSEQFRIYANGSDFRFYWYDTTNGAWRYDQIADATLAALAAYNTNGLLTQTAADTFTGRTITGPAAGISITNGNGVSGNPTLALANDLSALEGLSSTGIAVRTASDTWAQRTITGTSNKITVTNGDGVSGNPTLNVGSDVYTVGGTDVAVADGGTGASTASGARTNLGAADDSAVVKLTGDQTVAGVKTFSSDPIIPDEAYSSSWNGVLEPPTKNAVYDKIETLGSGASALTILAQPVNPVDPAAGAPFATLGITDNTTMHVYQIIVPFKITANKFSIRTVAVATPGTLDVTLYAEDGQSQIFSSTTATLSSANSVNTESLSAVSIPAGIYYLGVNGNGVLNVQVWSWDTDSGFNGASTLVAGVSSEPVLEGTLTISAGAPPSTITPSSITGARLHAPIIRFDN